MKHLLTYFWNKNGENLKKSVKNFKKIKIIFAENKEENASKQDAALFIELVGQNKSLLDKRGTRCYNLSIVKNG